MFSSALKSFASSNINSNYSVSQQLTSAAGPWKIYDATKKSTGKPYSVFVFDRKALDAHTGSIGRSGAAAYKRSVEEVVERLKKEASALARLRHPNILELVEPVEETRGGGLQFVTEPVTASLASLLQEKDDQERAGGIGGRSSRYVTEDADGVRRRREMEIDELEIQKGLLQISKALEFLHDNAGLVHGNLTPDAVLVNAKSDWKVSGLSFCSPPENSSKATSFQPISLSEALNVDSRLPRSVQLNLDYTSPDFALDNNLTASADMFSLGLVAVALYNSPHRSPLESHGSLSTCKRNLSNSSTFPSPSNRFLASHQLPRELSTHVLPRLITRRPAQRMTAREFQQSEYFDNILVSTIRFLDSFPAKTPGEKNQFLRGLLKVLPSFPKAVMEKKLLPALLDEMKDKDLLSLILSNIFKIISLLPAARRAFSDRVRPSLKEIFVTNTKAPQEKDPARDAGLMVVLENMSTIGQNCSGKEFKDDILPIVLVALESPTPSLVDVTLRSLPTILPVLDFSTIKNELFPVIATIFSKTNSLAIKVRGLQAFVALCGGSLDGAEDDGLDAFGGSSGSKKATSSALDKYTMQEKIIPLIKAIKTKEPAVMVAALEVLRVVGQAADAEFVAMEILPILWSMSLGPLLNLKQFKAFMDLIKSLSRRVEEEQTKKLQELTGGSSSAVAGPNEDFMAFGGVTGTSFDEPNNTTEDDFERLVKGNSGAASSSHVASWDEAPSTSGMPPQAIQKLSHDSPRTPTFSWSTTTNTTTAGGSSGTGVGAQKPNLGFRTVTPDLARFEALTPSSTQFSQPLQPSNSIPPPNPVTNTTQSSSSVNWSAAASSHTPSSSWSTTSTAPVSQPNYSGFGAMNTSMATLSMGTNQPIQQQRPGLPLQPSSFSIPPPQRGPSNLSSFSLPPPPGGQPSQWASPTSSIAPPIGIGGMASLQSSNRGGIPPPPMGGIMAPSGGMSGMAMNMNASRNGPNNTMVSQAKPKSGLDQYESLL